MNRRGFSVSYLVIASLAGMIAWLGISGRAEAYPQWQFTSGATRCNQCHYAPAGAGLITGYGRDAIGEELSTWEGEGAFLHGKADLPDWLKLGFDTRIALVSSNVGGPDQPKLAWFPMQIDAQARLEFRDVSFTGIAGVRGQVRKNTQFIPDDNAQPDNASRFVSREHFVTWSPSSRGPYARAGRFFAPFGLRVAEHIMYVRRDLGFNTLEETYNVSGGYLDNDWEVHVTAFAPDVLQGGNPDKGAAAYYERRVLDQKGALAVQGKFGTLNRVNVAIGGVLGKYYIEPAHLLVMAEANLVHLMPAGVPAANQVVSAFGLSFLPVRGIMLTGFAEWKQTDIKVKDSANTAAMGLLSWFPYPHFEIQLVGRLEMQTMGTPGKEFLGQIHYFL